MGGLATSDIIRDRTSGETDFDVLLAVGSAAVLYLNGKRIKRREDELKRNQKVLDTLKASGVKSP